MYSSMAPRAPAQPRVRGATNVARPIFVSMETGKWRNMPFTMVKGMLRHLPVSMLTKMGLATFVAPRTRGWAGARGAIEEYIEEQETHHREALGLDGLVAMASSEVSNSKTRQE